MKLVDRGELALVEKRVAELSRCVAIGSGRGTEEVSSLIAAIADLPAHVEVERQIQALREIMRYLYPRDADPASFLRAADVAVEKAWCSGDKKLVLVARRLQGVSLLHVRQYSQAAQALAEAFELALRLRSSLELQSVLNRSLAGAQSSNLLV